MATTTEPLAATSPPREPSSPRPRAFWIAAILSIVLVGAFFLQVFWADLLVTPWYLPIGGTICAIVAFRSIGRPARWWRIAVTTFCSLLAGLEWLFVAVLSLVPAYTGPIAADSDLPAFHAALADGTEISESFFANGKPTALVFFQGRWCPFCMTQLRELEAHHDEFTRVGARAVVVSLEDLDDAAKTQQQFPHLVVVADQKRELSNAVDLINPGFGPDGQDADAPTVLLLDGQGKVRWLHRPARFITRPSASELAAEIERRVKS